MNRDASASPDSLRIARDLLRRQAAPGKDDNPERAAAALQQTLLRVTESLRDSMGVDGCNALIVRALARTEADHPALKQICRISDNNSIYLDGVASSVETHGITAVTAASEALIAALLDALGRLIGEDMALQLIHHDPPRPRKGRGAQAP